MVGGGGPPAACGRHAPPRSGSAHPCALGGCRPARRLLEAPPAVAATVFFHAPLLPPLPVPWRPLPGARWVPPAWGGGLSPAPAAAGGTHHLSPRAGAPFFDKTGGRRPLQKSTHRHARAAQYKWERRTRLLPHTPPAEKGSSPPRTGACPSRRRPFPLLVIESVRGVDAPLQGTHLQKAGRLEKTAAPPPERKHPGAAGAAPTRPARLGPGWRRCGRALLPTPRALRPPAPLPPRRRRPCRRSTPSPPPQPCLAAPASRSESHAGGRAAGDQTHSGDSRGERGGGRGWLLRGQGEEGL